MADGPLEVNALPALPSRLVSLDSAPVLFPALAPPDYEPRGVVARIRRTERTA
jgi:hypothetical protein